MWTLLRRAYRGYALFLLWRFFDCVKCSKSIFEKFVNPFDHEMHKQNRLMYSFSEL